MLTLKQKSLVRRAKRRGRHPNEVATDLGVTLWDVVEYWAWLQTPWRSRKPLTTSEVARLEDLTKPAVEDFRLKQIADNLRRPMVIVWAWCYENGRFGDSEGFSEFDVPLRRGPGGEMIPDKRASWWWVLICVPLAFIALVFAQFVNESRQRASEVAHRTPDKMTYSMDTVDHDERRLPHTGRKYVYTEESGRTSFHGDPPANETPPIWHTIQPHYPFYLLWVVAVVLIWIVFVRMILPSYAKQLKAVNDAEDEREREERARRRREGR